MTPASFRARFGRAPTAMAEAPGRVNLIGEHTDYNDGWVLPTVVPQRTRASCAPGLGRRVRIASTAVPDPEEFDLGAETRRGSWGDYVRGVTWALANAGYPVDGFDLEVETTVPLGAGLSSSAALAVALLRALRAMFSLDLDDLAIARLSQRAESEFVGARVGLMDQLACSLGTPGVALLIDTRDVVWRTIPLPAVTDWVVIDSGVRHALVDGRYNARRAECERACALLGITSLRDADETAPDRLPAPLDRRVRHVLSENARVLASAAGLEAGDLAAVGAALCESHRSQREDYEVSVTDVDLLVELASAHPDVYGARLTGGGFGGAVVAMTRAGAGAAVGPTVAARHRARTGRATRLLVP